MRRHVIVSLLRGRSDVRIAFGELERFGGWFEVGSSVFVGSLCGRTVSGWMVGVVWCCWIALQIDIIRVTGVPGTSPKEFRQVAVEGESFAEGRIAG